MKHDNVKIEVHLIQNFAPSNLNRDDTGQPKSAFFGGCRRARISSQCEKRATRTWWQERETVTLGQRTKRLQGLIDQKLARDEGFARRGVSAEDRVDGVRIFTEAYYASSDKKRPELTNVPIFIGQEEVDACVEAIRILWDDKSKDTTKKGKQVTAMVEGIATVVQRLHVFNAKNAGGKATADDDDDTVESVEPDEAQGGASAEGPEAVKRPKKPKLAPNDETKKLIAAAQVSADIALFGRMLAEQPGRNTDGACQVAHPISTHKVDMEMDFFTAVDDVNPSEETGASMMGVVGFNSACYYRYALVDRDQLARNLARKTARKNDAWVQDLEDHDYTEADEVIKAFLEAMVYAIPTGKQNSFAAQNLPSFGLFIRRQGGVPISLANAYVTPIRAKRDDDDLVGLSVEALTEHWEALAKCYGQQGAKVLSCFQVQQEGRLHGLAAFDRGTVEDAILAVMEG